MSKAEFIANVAKAGDMSNAEAKRVVELVFGEIESGLKRGGVRASVEATAEKVNHKQRPALMDESSSDFFFYPVGGGLPLAAPAPAPFEPPRATAPQGGGTPVAPPPPVTSAPPQVTSAPPAPIGGGASSRTEAQREYDLWEQAVRANTRSAFESFLRDIPNGRYSDRARARIAQFGAPAPAAAPAPAPAPATAAANNSAAEFALWDRAQTSKRRADYEAYLQQYPSGRYADRARAALPKAQ